MNLMHLCKWQTPVLLGYVKHILYTDKSDSIVCPRGYSTLRKDRNKYGGGVALLIRTVIMMKHATVPAIYDKLESICAGIIVNDVMFHIILYYRPLHNSSVNLISRPSSKLSLLYILYFILYEL